MSKQRAIQFQLANLGRQRQADCSARNPTAATTSATWPDRCGPTRSSIAIAAVVDAHRGADVGQRVRQPRIVDPRRAQAAGNVVLQRHGGGRVVADFEIRSSPCPRSLLSSQRRELAPQRIGQGIAQFGRYLQRLGLAANRDRRASEDRPVPRTRRGGNRRRQTSLAAAACRASRRACRGTVRESSERFTSRRTIALAGVFSGSKISMTPFSTDDLRRMIAEMGRRQQLPGAPRAVGPARDPQASAGGSSRAAPADRPRRVPSSRSNIRGTLPRRATIRRAALRRRARRSRDREPGCPSPRTNSAERTLTFRPG